MNAQDRYRSQFRQDPPKAPAPVDFLVSESPEEQRKRRHVSQFGSWPEGSAPAPAVPGSSAPSKVPKKNPKKAAK